MVALLGVMVALLGLIAVVGSLVLTAIGFYGFQTIRDEAKKAAVLTATKVAKQEAKKVISHARKIAQASGLIESQAEDMPIPVVVRQANRAKVRKYSDAGLDGSGGKTNGD